MQRAAASGQGDKARTAVGNGWSAERNDRMNAYPLQLAEATA